MDLPAVATTHGSHNAVRSTQRPPKSCAACYRRKIKCDREFPCSQCRRRGEAASCRVETVLVKGRLVRNRDDMMQPSYEHVVRENARLRSRETESGLPHALAATTYREDLVDEKEQLLFARLRSHHSPRTVRHVGDVLFPSPSCAAVLFAARCPQTWLHLAVDHDDFTQGRLRFEHLTSLGSAPGDAADSAWLALYFACLAARLNFMSDDAACGAGLPHCDMADSPAAVLRNWYHAALYFLHRADFLSVLDLRNVQAIIILDVLFTNQGDLNLYTTLWPCAIRISQALRIHVGRGEESQENENEHEHARGAIRNTRIWWALVSTDWLSGQLNPPSVREADFSLELPPMAPPSHTGPAMTSGDDAASAQYFACMACISCVLYRFRTSVSLVQNDADPSIIAGHVLRADNDLAEIISKLPPHLRQHPGGEGEEGGAESERASEAAAPDEEEGDDDDAMCPRRDGSSTVHPDLEWQRLSIAVALLYTRIVVNRAPLRGGATKGHGDEMGRRRALAIYLSSAHAIMDAITKSSVETPRLQIWSFQLALYSSVAAIIANMESCPCGLDEDDHREKVWESIAFLERQQGRSVLAGYATESLVKMLHEQTS